MMVIPIRWSRTHLRSTGLFPDMPAQPARFACSAQLTRKPASHARRLRTGRTVARFGYVFTDTSLLGTVSTSAGSLSFTQFTASASAASSVYTIRLLVRRCSTAHFFSMRTTPSRATQRLCRFLGGAPMSDASGSVRLFSLQWVKRNFGGGRFAANGVEFLVEGARTV
jgi:hypothetical protein